MNARILRKWSIHTKNLMSCSACSLVVVVLLLLLLLVTCAPSLVLATTMNPALYTPSSSSSSSSSSSLSLVAPLLPSAVSSSSSSPSPSESAITSSSSSSLVVNPQHMPKNIQVLVVGQEPPPAPATTQIRRTRRPSTTTRTTATGSSSSSAAAAAATSLAHHHQQQPTDLPATLLPNQRQSHSRLASPNVEVEASKASATNGDILARESFPGFYTNHHRNHRPDDKQSTLGPWLAPWRHHHQAGILRQLSWFSSPGYESSSPHKDDGSSSSSSNKPINGWFNQPSTSSTSTSTFTSSSFNKPPKSYNDDNGAIEAYDAHDHDDGDNTKEDIYDDMEDEDDTQTTDNNNPSVANSHDNSQLEEEDEEDEQYVDVELEAAAAAATAEELPLYSKPKKSVRNVVDTPVMTVPAGASMSARSNTYPYQHFQHRPLQQFYNPRRHHIAPSMNPAMTTQTTPRTLTTLFPFYKQTEILGSASSSHPIYSPKDHKSMAMTMVEGGVGGGGKDKVFDISNILNVNKIKSSASTAPIRFIIESYEVPRIMGRQQNAASKRRITTTVLEERNVEEEVNRSPPKPHLKQLRSRQQEQQLAARSRRDSLRNNYNKRYQPEMETRPSSGLTSSSGSASASVLTTHTQSFRNKFQQHPQQQQQQQHHNHQHQHHNHHHNNKNLRYQRMRQKHPRRYCSARDPAQLAFEAPTVFEGKIVSMTPDRRMNFSATVEVREVFKQQIGYRLQKYLRLQFAYRNSSGECDIYREQLRARGLVKGDTIEPGRMYLLFVQQIDIGNFTILGEPIRKTKRVVDAVRDAVSENYAQLASIRSISASNRTVENGQELRIVCKVTGRPPPKVTWFKDHRSINRNRKLYQFAHYKKRSELIIRSFNTSDAGRYECRAKNKVNRNIERRTIVIKAHPVQRFDSNPRGAGNTCPDDVSEFCLNGGTCKFFSEINSYSCICPEGFVGERCEGKEVNNPNFMLQSTAKYTPF
ncbi:uncharacterized protein LOC106092913 isoform X2 [Stomoxys calcitrans]|nr:uncharacterized protein LOC106092913 isoform X2 [Stomoxys calcitrans]